MVVAAYAEITTTNSRKRLSIGSVVSFAVKYL